MKLVFAVKTLSTRGGGAERVLASVSTGLALRGHAVTLVTCDPPATESFYSIDAPVRTINLDLRNASSRTSVSDFVARVGALHRLLAHMKPDVAIGFMNSIYVPLGLAALGTGVPVIASEHGGAEYYKERLLDTAFLNITPLIAKRITVVSEQTRRAYNRWLRWHMTVAANPVAADLHSGIHANMGVEANRRKVLLCVGRLEAEKDHKVLVAAFATIADALPDWNLRIVGDGRLRSDLEGQVRELGLTSRVSLPGFRSEIDAEYRGAHLLVIPSLYESFGLVAAEALLHHLPIVGFADCPGTNQLIRHGENGVLVAGEDRVSSLAQALKGLMSDSVERERLAAADNGWIVGEFALAPVLDQWERLLREAAGSE